jgi:hypothetical protein
MTHYGFDWSVKGRDGGGLFSLEVLAKPGVDRLGGKAKGRRRYRCVDADYAESPCGTHGQGRGPLERPA